jgi:hypothetical protein
MLFGSQTGTRFKERNIPRGASGGSRVMEFGSGATRRDRTGDLLITNWEIAWRMGVHNCVGSSSLSSLVRGVRVRADVFARILSSKLSSDGTVISFATWS